MAVKIPKKNADLIRYVRVRGFLQTLGFALWVAALVSGALAYNAAHQTYPPEDRILGWKLAVWIAAAVVSGFFLFRIRKLIFSRTVVGEVIASGLSHGYTHSADPGASSAVSYDFRLHTHLTVKTERGKRKKLKFEQKPGFYLYYYEGNRVCKLAGLPYPICDPAHAARPERGKAAGAEDPHDDPSGGYLCVACGRINKELNAPCEGCSHSLIDPRELFGYPNA